LIKNQQVALYKDFYNKKEIGKIDFSNILNQHQIVSINVAASASSGKVLNEEDS
jgi:hypothetical protein